MTRRFACATRPACRALGISLALLTRAGPSQAEDASLKFTDGVYGRFDGDLDISLAAGAMLVREGPAGALLGRAFYLGTAGMYVAYTDSLGSSIPVPRSLGLGVALRPFFIPRWGYDLDRGPAILDLTIDATTFDLGVLWAADADGRFTQLPGIELALGTEVPLAGQASGPWIGVRGVLRWRGSELASTEGIEDELQPAIFLTFAWHVLANVHLVDANDRLFR